MSSNDRSDREEEFLGSQSPNGGNTNSNEIPGSPVESQRSNSTSLSGRQHHRVVELLPNAEVQPNQWSISRQFYDIDVTADSEDEDDDNANDEDDPDYQMEMELPDEDDDDEEEDEEEDDLYGLDDFNHLNDIVLIEPHHEEQSSNESDDQELDPNYDTGRPVGHHYLGEHLEESRGREVLIEGSITKLPLINLRHVVLFPNQILPITTSHLSPLIQSCLKRCVENHHTIGIISEPYNNLIGTTAEIRNYTSLDDELRIIMEGRQRFRLISPPFDTARAEGDVLVLDEITLGPPYPKTPSLMKYSTNPKVFDNLIYSKHPKWVLKKYDGNKIIVKILNQIKDWCNPDSIKNPCDFSYWVASNLPISNSERIKILSFDCTESRLLWLLDKLENSKWFCCSSCNNVICYKKDVFPMSKSGPQCSFVNSHGLIHDTLTVKSATGLLLEYDWSDEFSWFPGYKWRVAYCNQCNRHIGWCYHRIEDNTIPRRFFGLSRSNVKLSTENPSDNPLPQEREEENMR